MTAETVKMFSSTFKLIPCIFVISAYDHIFRESVRRKDQALVFMMEKLKSFFSYKARLHLYSGPSVRKCIT